MTDTHFSISSRGRGTAGGCSITSAFSHLDSNVSVPLFGQSTVPGWAGAWSSRAVRRLQQHSADMGDVATKVGSEPGGKSVSLESVRLENSMSISFMLCLS